MVSSVIKEFQENGTIISGIRLNLNAGDWITFLARIHWDEKITNVDDLSTWLQNQFSIEYFVPAGISASHPLIFAAFVVTELNKIPVITRELRNNPAVTSVVTIIGEPSKTFPDIRTIRLKELIAEAGL
jgi:hypothetical protein